MLNFIYGGLIGDFIQCMFAVNQLCKIHNTKANLYVTDNLSFGGDRFKFPIQKVYEDLLPVVSQQKYINTFEIFSNQTNQLINLNDFRKSPLLYHNNWTEFLQETFKFKYMPPYQWITINEVDKQFSDKIIIHRSLKRHLSTFPLKEIVDKNKDRLIFVSNDINEYKAFPFSNIIPFHQTTNLIEYYSAINACDFFIGNQSSPYTLATSLDKLRVIEIGDTPDKTSSIGEDKYTSNIMDVLKII